MTIQCGTAPRSSIASCDVSTLTMRRYIYLPADWAQPFYIPGKKCVAQQKASLSQQMLQKSVVLNLCEGAGASFPPVAMATPMWHLQTAQVP